MDSTPRRVTAPFLALTLSFVTATCCAAGAEESDQPLPTDQARFFETAIRPLLADHCYECHGPDEQESGLRVDSLAGMLKGGKAGPSIAAGKPESSLLITAVGYRDNTLQMPPDEKLTKRQIADLTRWVKMGAPHPDGDSARAVRSSGIDLDEVRKHWAFRPPLKPKAPTVSDLAWVRTPVDAFILARLDAAKLEPVASADKRTLLRRVTFDLIGLPPTPDEVDAFVADNSDGAYERVVDRLLDSPHYGERWGRHWLDIARYADSNGLDENVAHGNAWRYRDYVVESLNDDKPYDRFLVEQLAGDLLDSGSDVGLRNDRLIATGFLSLGPKVLAEVDERKMEMDIVDEQIDTIGRALFGLTLGCARCHDHKFDPFEQRDYYALAGVFKSTRTMQNFKKVARWNEVSIATPDQVARKKTHDERVAAAKKEIERRIATANAELTAQAPAGQTRAKKPEEHYSETTKAELARLRAALKRLEQSAPLLPTAMGVADGEVRDVAIHLRGSHLSLGDTVARRFPRAFTGADPTPIAEDRSGRLEFARWLTRPDHPLTARVMINRIWRWHFGKGLVPTPDNFGRTGQPPTHPKLLDWLATRFVEEGWSIKAVHRLILLSATYRLASDADGSDAEADPLNRLYRRRDVRRLEAEAIRDAMLAVDGTLDRTFGGSLLSVGNREYFFNHTSQDKTTYDTRRRSIYVPVVRNHLYGVFQLFDYSDASVLNGDRSTSTVAPQALFLMNSEFVFEAAHEMATRSLAEKISDRERIDRLHRTAFARPATDTEITRSLAFVDRFASASVTSEHDQGKRRRQAWQALCQAILSSNEFVYVR